MSNNPHFVPESVTCIDRDEKEESKAGLGGRKYEELKVLITFTSVGDTSDIKTIEVVDVVSKSVDLGAYSGTPTPPIGVRAEKPTLGIKPKKIWIEERIEKLAEAMRKRLNAGQEFPDKWLNEYNELVIELNSL